MDAISGKEISKVILKELGSEIINLKAQKIDVTLAVVLVGDDPASKVYVNSKKKTCADIGIISKEFILPKDASEKDLIDLIKKLNADKSINGILCQVPLPKQIDEERVIESIDPLKDVDCFHPFNLGLLTSGMPRFMPCTPFGVMQLLKRKNFSLEGKNVVVLGRSNIVGRPLSIMMSLKGFDATVTLCHSKTKNLKEVCASADILVAAIGKAKFVTKEFVKQNAIVIDVGINEVESHDGKRHIVGDVDYEDISSKAKAATPVPGGVGPMTIAMLMYNTINAARYANGLNKFEI